jgi:hypothetical protein
MICSWSVVAYAVTTFFGEGNYSRVSLMFPWILLLIAKLTLVVDMTG